MCLYPNVPFVLLSTPCIIVLEAHRRQRRCPSLKLCTPTYWFFVTILSTQRLPIKKIVWGRCTCPFVPPPSNLPWRPVTSCVQVDSISLPVRQTSFHIFCTVKRFHSISSTAVSIDVCKSKLLAGAVTSRRPNTDMGVPCSHVKVLTEHISCFANIRWFRWTLMKDYME